MMPLTMANPGECYTIRKVGGKEETRRFLENLGFVVGGNVTVVSEINGNLIVNVGFQGGRWKRYGSQNPDLIGKKERK